MSSEYLEGEGWHEFVQLFEPVAEPAAAANASLGIARHSYQVLGANAISVADVNKEHGTAESNFLPRHARGQYQQQAIAEAEGIVSRERRAVWVEKYGPGLAMAGIALGAPIFAPGIFSAMTGSKSNQQIEDPNPFISPENEQAVINEANQIVHKVERDVKREVAAYNKRRAAYEVTPPVTPELRNRPPLPAWRRYLGHGTVHDPWAEQRVAGKLPGRRLFNTARRPQQILPLGPAAEQIVDPPQSSLNTLRWEWQEEAIESRKRAAQILPPPAE